MERIRDLVENHGYSYTSEWDGVPIVRSGRAYIVAVGVRVPADFNGAAQNIGRVLLRGPRGGARMAWVALKADGRPHFVVC